MDKYSLYGLMEANGLNTGQLMAHYSFSGTSGMLTFNEAYEVSGANWMSGHFLDWPSTGKVDYSLYPGLSVGETDLHVSTISPDGSGFFIGNSILKVGSGIGSDEWTAFLSFSGLPPSDRKDLANVIISTASAPESNSGFFLGQNSRSMFVESYNTESSPAVSEINVFPKASLEKNLISLSKNEYGRISLGLHDFSDGDNLYSETFLLNGYTDSDQIYIGGFNLNQDLAYTGFSGYIDDFLLISGSIGELERKDIGKAIFAFNYQASQYTETSAEVVAISGMSLETGVTDSGVTGYEYAFIETVTNLAGESISTYISSGVTGEITGEFFSGVTGSGTTTEITTTLTDEIVSYNQDTVKSYAPEAIVFENKLSATDVYEIYSQKSRSDSMGVQTYYNTSKTMFFTSLDFTGIEQNNEIGLIYANGKLLESGETDTGMYVRDGDFMINASGYFGQDFVIYDRITNYSGGQIYYTTTAETGFNFTDDKYLEKDVYYEGIKLLSGKQWTGYDGYMEVTQTSYAGGNVEAGILSFVPVVKNEFERATGLGPIGKVVPGFKMINEQVWVNGIRQRKDYDFYSLHAGNALVSDSRQTPSSHLLYSGETKGWGI